MPMLWPPEKPALPSWAFRVVTHDPDARRLLEVAALPEAVG